MLREKDDALKPEFEFFYPLDVRSSAKDLVPNHPTFALHNHAAIFPQEMFLLSMCTIGHLMFNGKKMSKSTANSLTWKEAIEKFGADAARLLLVDAGDGLEDANFGAKPANANGLRINISLGWCEVGAGECIGRLKLKAVIGYGQRPSQSQPRTLYLP